MYIYVSSFCNHFKLLFFDSKGTKLKSEHHVKFSQAQIKKVITVKSY